MFLDTLLGSGTIVAAIILSFVPLIESLGSKGVRVPEKLVRDLAEIGKIFLAFAVYTSVALLYMIYRIVQLFSTLTTKKEN